MRLSDIDWPWDREAERWFKAFVVIVFLVGVFVWEDLRRRWKAAIALAKGEDR